MVGRTIAGRYTIRATIGSGGMGFVYRATQAPIDREVALKVLRLDLAHQDGIAERFTREAKAASRVVHPNAITIYEFGEDDGVFYLAMELLSGETLRQRMRHDPPLEVEHALDIFEAMGGALASAHGEGVIHRDLKPDNIFLAHFKGKGEVVKVLDFGLAKLLDRADPDGLVTDVNLRLGTPRYMAPEQAMGSAIDARCDVYALGLLLFEMLAGRAPFTGEDGMEVLAQRLRREAPRLSQIAPLRGFSEEMDELLAGMLVRDREHRPADAGVVVARLHAMRAAGLIYRPAEWANSESDLPEMQVSAPLHMPTPVSRQRTPSLPGYGASNPGVMSSPGLAPPRAAPSESLSFVPASQAPSDSLALDDFDKPTVVISSREDYLAQNAPSQATPVSPMTFDSPVEAEAPTEYKGPRSSGPRSSVEFKGVKPEYISGKAPITSASHPGAVPSLRPTPLGLSRPVVVILLLIAVGAPLLALLIRWSQNREVPVEAIPGPGVEAPQKGPPPKGVAPVMKVEKLPPEERRDPVRPAPAVAERPKNCTIRIESTPPGAVVERDGTRLGPTPYVDTLPYGATPVKYRLVLPGHEPYEKSVVPEHRRTINATLRPEGGKAVPVKPLPLKATTPANPAKPPERPPGAERPQAPRGATPRPTGSRKQTGPVLSPVF